MHYRYPSIDTISSINIPLLILHGTNDNMIPVSHGRDLFSSYMRNKTTCFLPQGQASRKCQTEEGSVSKYVEIDGADHHNLLYTTEWLKEVPRFINPINEHSV